MDSLSLSPELTRVAPRTALGVLTYQAKVEHGNDELRELVTAEVARVRAEIEPGALTAQPEISALREVYRALGRDPGRYRGSAEALLRRVLSGKGLYEVNSVVDVNNLISLRSRAAVGSYDADRVRGPVVFGPAGEDETYDAIGKGPLRLGGLPVFRDSEGPFGSPTSDSERTMIRDDSTRVTTVIIAFTGADIAQWLDFATSVVTTRTRADVVATEIVMA